VLDVQWFYSGRSQEVMAVQVHGRFVEMPAFSGRLLQTGNAGLVLLDLMTQDSGRYSVEVVGGDPHSSTVDRLERFVTLEVAGQSLITCCCFFLVCCLLCLLLFPL
jgi:hypothetical protein